MGKGLSAKQDRILIYLANRDAPVDFDILHREVGLSTPGNTLRALRGLEKRGFAKEFTIEATYRINDKGRAALAKYMAEKGEESSVNKQKEKGA